MKQCSKCCETKELDKFYRNKSTKDGYHCRCKQCHESGRDPYKHNKVKRDSHYRNKYGISLSDYDRMFQVQGGRCAICRQTDTKRLVVDHNHETGKVRALLCGSCNKLLGMAKENLDTLNEAINYLKVHG